MMYNYLERCDIPVEIYEYDPLAPDDVFDLFKQNWNEIPMSEKKSKLGIRTQKQINTIDDAINKDHVKSMISLIEYPGIGVATLDKCFRYVMSYKKEPTLNF